MNQTFAHSPYIMPKSIRTIRHSAIDAWGYFYIGGQDMEDDKTRHYTHGQMYMEVFVPKNIIRPYPLVLFHGGGQTGASWTMTAEGRPGWVNFFVEQGYVVYVADVPARGRSAYHPATDGSLVYMTADLTNTYFAASDGNWSTAYLHTQWPTREPCDSRGYDANYVELCKAQVEYLPPAKQQELVQAAGKALLDRIGPSILLTHSMAGPYGWLIADACPEFVKGIIALEPSGPPFAGISISKGRQRPYGITDIPLTYEPAINPPKWRLQDEGAITPPNVADVDAWMQQEPAGKLINLSKIPVLLMTAEASYHAPFDHLTAAYLRQAGVNVDFKPLTSFGIHGNGHMMMLEKNSDEIAQIIHGWIMNSV